MLKSSKYSIIGRDNKAINDLLNKALSILEELLTINDTHRQAIYNKAKVLLLLGDITNSLNTYRKLIEIDSSFLFTLFRDQDFFFHSDIGNSLINEFNSSYLADLSLAGSVFYDKIEETILYQIELPEQVFDWLKKEEIETRGKWAEKLQNITLMDCVKKQTDYKNLFMQANIELSSVIENYHKEFCENCMNYSNYIESKYLHSSLFPKRVLSSIKDINLAIKRHTENRSVVTAKTHKALLEDLSDLACMSVRVNKLIPEYDNLTKMQDYSFYLEYIKQNELLQEDNSLMLKLLFACLFFSGFFFFLGVGIGIFFTILLMINWLSMYRNILGKRFKKRVFLSLMSLNNVDTPVAHKEYIYNTLASK